jgi:hypothetical protein
MPDAGYADFAVYAPKAEVTLLAALYNRKLLLTDALLQPERVERQLAQLFV